MKRDRFKKIYVEVSNICNLNCPFCLKTKREKRSLSIDEFKKILNKIKPYTKYLYLHVLGEPLLHKDINEFIKLAKENEFYINLTSNGYLINNLKETVRQINISLHSYNEMYNKNLVDYLTDIYNYSIKNCHDTYINYRMWASSKYKGEIIKFLESKYNVTINEKQNNIKLADNIFLNFDTEFIWPENNKESKEYQGKCYALKDHIAILSDGTVVPCCLDGGGKIVLGNILKDDFDKILNNEKTTKLDKELRSGIRTNELCKKCNFLD